MAKKRFTTDINIKAIRDEIKRTYINKYYNLYIDSIKFNNISYEQQDYIMKKLWEIGTLAAFKIKHTNDLGFTTYAASKYNMYELPETVQLINKYNVPFIPANQQIVNKDVVLCWAQSNHQPVRRIVNNYISRIVNVEMVINTNLNTAKLPFLIGVTEEDIDRAKDIINRILNDEIAVFANLNDLVVAKDFAVNTPYIIDKLYAYKTSLENELLTYLGIDNSLDDPTKDRLLVDQVNANNSLINANQAGFKKNLDGFCEKVKEILGVEISYEFVYKAVDSVHDDKEEQEDESLL